MTNPDFARSALPRWIALLALLSIAWMAPSQAQTGPIEDLDRFPHARLEIVLGKKQQLTYEIWEADTPNRQAQGLMFVRSLPALHGMLFVHESPRLVSMWMKNTYIPLDMVFIDPKGRIQQIVAQTTPHSLAVISSTKPARAVLEIGGGEAERLGIKPGQQVIHPAFSKR